MKEVTSDLVYQICQDLYAKNSKDFYDIDMFLGDIQNMLQKSWDNKEYQYDWECSCNILFGIMAWLRCAEGVNAFNDQGATNIMIEMTSWCDNLPKAED